MVQNLILTIMLEKSAVRAENDSTAMVFISKSFQNATDDIIHHPDAWCRWETWARIVLAVDVLSCVTAQGLSHTVWHAGAWSVLQQTGSTLVRGVPRHDTQTHTRTYIHSHTHTHTAPIMAAFHHRKADKNITSPIRQLNVERQWSVLAA